MNSQISSLVTKFSSLAWLFIPPILLFVALSFAYHNYTIPLDKWFADMSWLNYVALAIAGGIALQFGRSRLVYCCLLLLLFIPTISEFFFSYTNYNELRLYFVLMTITWLILGRDRGFSAINILYTSAVLFILAGFSWLLVAHLQSTLLPKLAPIDNVMFRFMPDIRQQFTSLALLFFATCIVISFIRLIWKCDNNHNGLFFALMLIAPLHLISSDTFIQLTLLFLACLFCYAVIKDSFTMAFKDELTTIPSRRALMQYVQTLGRKYTVVMSDIDHFKKFNDTYGHDVGDEVLKLVASKLNKVTGGGKTFRFGGEEFVIVFPRKNAQEVVPYVEIIRQVIASYDIALRTKPRPVKPPKNTQKKATNAKPARDKIVKVTTSFGIAQRTKEASDFTQVMKQADIALYAAKKAGRNCVKVAKQA